MQHQPFGAHPRLQAGERGLGALGHHLGVAAELGRHHDHQSAPAVDAAFADPPRTSEQVLDPARYAAREPAVVVPRPQVAGEVVDEGVVGELLVLLVLADDLGVDDARTAAAGWGGDWGVAWRDGDRSCVTANLVGDDQGQTDQMRAAFERWAGEHDATITPGAPGQPFTVESCSA